MEVTHDGKVKKIIIEVTSIFLKSSYQVGEGVKKPKRNYLAKFTYKSYFFDHEEIDSTHVEEPIVISLGDIAYPEGLFKGIEEMRKNEKAKITI